MQYCRVVSLVYSSQSRAIGAPLQVGEDEEAAARCSLPEDARAVKVHVSARVCPVRTSAGKVARHQFWESIRPHPFASNHPHHHRASVGSRIQVALRCDAMLIQLNAQQNIVIASNDDLFQAMCPISVTSGPNSGLNSDVNLGQNLNRECELATQSARDSPKESGSESGCGSESESEPRAIDTSPPVVKGGNWLRHIQF